MNQKLLDTMTALSKERVQEISVVYTDTPGLLTDLQERASQFKDADLVNDMLSSGKFRHAIIAANTEMRRNQSVRWSKVISKYLYERYKIKLDKNTLSIVTNLAKEREINLKEYVDVVKNVDWEDGYFGKSDSCWWNEGAIQAWNSEKEAFCLRFWKPQMNGSFGHRSDYRQGIGRMWIWVKDEGALMFNLYYKDNDIENTSSVLRPIQASYIMRNLLGYTGIYRVSVSSYDFYVNDNTGYLITPEEEKDHKDKFFLEERQEPIRSREPDNDDDYVDDFLNRNTNTLGYFEVNARFILPPDELADVPTLEARRTVLRELANVSGMLTEDEAREVARLATNITIEYTSNNPSMNYLQNVASYYVTDEMRLALSYPNLPHPRWIVMAGHLCLRMLRERVEELMAQIRQNILRELRGETNMFEENDAYDMGVYILEVICAYAKVRVVSQNYLNAMTEYVDNAFVNMRNATPVTAQEISAFRDTILRSDISRFLEMSDTASIEAVLTLWAEIYVYTTKKASYAIYSVMGNTPITPGMRNDFYNRAVASMREEIRVILAGIAQAQREPPPHQ